MRGYNIGFPPGKKELVNRNAIIKPKIGYPVKPLSWKPWRPPPRARILAKTWTTPSPGFSTLVHLWHTAKSQLGMKNRHFWKWFIMPNAFWIIDDISQIVDNINRYHNEWLIVISICCFVFRWSPPYHFLILSSLECVCLALQWIACVDYINKTCPVNLVNVS